MQVCAIVLYSHPQTTMSGLLISRAHKLVTPTHYDTLELDVATHFL